MTAYLPHASQDSSLFKIEEDMSFGNFSEHIKR
jgi:hypothetical protein